MKRMISVRNMYAVIIAVWLSAGMAACSSKPSSDSNSEIQAIEVSVVLPETSGNDGVLASGVIESEQTAMISTRMMGTIENISVREGDKVQRGQLLATISNHEIIAKQKQVEASLLEASAALEYAAKDEARFRNLYNSGSVSPKELENVELHYKSMQARVEAVRQMQKEIEVALQYTQLRAPFAGVVTRVMSDAGTMASPGMPLLVVEQAGKLQVSASLAESDISRIKVGDTAHLTVKSTALSFTGVVKSISPSSQASGGQYPVTITLPDSLQLNLFAGMYVNVLLPETQGRLSELDASNPLIPTEAVFYREQLAGIWVVGNQNTAVLRWIRLGKTEGNRVAVVSGLSSNEQVIVSAKGKLYNGVSINIQSNQL